MNKTPDQEIQKQIYDLISKNPGVHLSKIAEMLDIKLSEVELQLKNLEKKGIITVIKEIGYEQYYIEDHSKKQRDKQTQITRKKIYELVANNPGLHLSKIAEMLEISVPLTNYHVQYMERKNELIAIKESGGYYKRYYTEDSAVGIQQKKILEILRKKIPLKIILFLIKHHNLKHKEISEKLGITPSKLSYHLSILVENNIVEANPHGKDKGYTLKNRKEIVRFLKKYDVKIILNIAIEDFKDVWEDLKL